MVKVGPAFFESISSEKIHSPKSRSSIVPKEFLNLIPLTVLILVVLCIVFRLFYLQVLRGDYYSKLSDQNRLRSNLIPAARGIIFDHKKRPLVSNSPAFKILDKKQPQGRQVIWLDKDEAFARISKGEEVASDVQRNYLYKDAFAHVLGYVGQMSEDDVMLPQFSEYGIADLVGKMGLEKEYEGYLHGKNGRELFEVDALGEKVRSLGKDEEVAGKNLITTLDLDVQLAAKDAMKDAAKGTVVVSDPRDGAIRAIYSKPTFDPNVFTHTDRYKGEGEYTSVEQILTDNKNQPLLDRAISGVYPPGSTYKLITAIAALENGAVTKDTKMEDTGVLKVGTFSFGNWYYNQYGRKEGIIDLVGAIKRSNDIFFYKTAEETGISELSRWSRKMGMGEILGIDLPHEEAGTVPDMAWKKDNIGEQWYLGDTYNMGIGQGYLLATPLQVNIWTTLFANDGTLYRPHLVEGQKEVLEKNFFKKEHRELVRQGMKESCERGGVAWPFFDFKVKNDHLTLDGKDYTESASGSAKMTRILVGCKTGTAESGDEKTLPHAWITVFAPYYNPEVVVTVLVENSGEGSSIAGPVAEKVLRKYFEEKK